MTPDPLQITCPTCAAESNRIRTSIAKRQTNLIRRQHTCKQCGRKWDTALPHTLPPGSKVPRHRLSGTCPYCCSSRIPATHSRATGATIERYHDCYGCGAHFRTFEPKKVDKPKK